MALILRPGAILALAWLIWSISGPQRALAGQEWDEVTQLDGLYAVLNTDLGPIVCTLLASRAPLTVANFVGLAEGTREFKDSETGEMVRRPFYEELLFHRVIEEFMIQTGDPTGTGLGGPGYRFRDEFDSGLSHDRPGTVSMANAGPNSNGSQFFITEVATPWLDDRHSVFGRVVYGQDVVDAIGASEVEEQRPLEPVYLQNVQIIRRGTAAKEFDAEAVFEQLKDLNQSELAERRAREFEERISQIRDDSKSNPDGSRYTVLQEGKGERPVTGQTIKVHYVCYLPDGTIVESTRQRTRPHAPGRGAATSRSGLGEPIPGDEAR